MDSWLGLRSPGSLWLTFCRLILLHPDNFDAENTASDTELDVWTGSSSLSFCLEVWSPGHRVKPGRLRLLKQSQEYYMDAKRGLFSWYTRSQLT
jgi:hypothetical protein